MSSSYCVRIDVFRGDVGQIIRRDKGGFGDGERKEGIGRNYYGILRVYACFYGKYLSAFELHPVALARIHAGGITLGGALSVN